jgi:hypothetical protein
MHFELKDEERKRLRKEKRERVGCLRPCPCEPKPYWRIGVGNMRLTLSVNTTPADRT